MATHRCLCLVIVNSVPRYLLEDVGRGGADPFRISDYTHGKMCNAYTNKMDIERFSVKLLKSLSLYKVIFNHPVKNKASQDALIIRYLLTFNIFNIRHI